MSLMKATWFSPYVSTY